VGTAFVVTSAAALFESAPFIVAAWMLTHTRLRRCAWMVPYLGCGCGTGPSARSLAAFAFTWVAFGPAIAAARFAAACGVARALRSPQPCCDRATALNELARMLPPAIGAGAVALLAPLLFPAHAWAPAAFALGAIAAFIAAPCGTGAVALAAALKTACAPAAFGFLCVAGIADLRALQRSPSETSGGHDTFAYAVAAAACALLAAQRAHGIVHPRLLPLLALAAAAFAFLAWRYRAQQDAALRAAPLLMFGAALIAAPPPEYHATQTSLAQAFAGERLDFTGIITQTGNATTLVRYAITCCRADAAPIVVRLERSRRDLQGWVHAGGTFVQGAEGLELRTALLRSVPAPPDAFVYR
jgi:hypothetical protein